MKFALVALRVYSSAQAGTFEPYDDEYQPCSTGEVWPARRREGLAGRVGLADREDPLARAVVTATSWPLASSVASGGRCQVWV